MLKLKLVVPEGLHRADRLAVGAAGSDAFIGVLHPRRGGHHCVVVGVIALPDGILMEVEASMQVGELAAIGASASRA